MTSFANVPAVLLQFSLYGMTFLGLVIWFHVLRLVLKRELAKLTKEAERTAKEAKEATARDVALECLDVADAAGKVDWLWPGLGWPRCAHL